MPASVILFPLFPFYAISSENQITDILNCLLEQDKGDYPVDDSIDAFTIKLRFGDPGDTVKTGANYTGDFPYGKWTLITRGCICHGTGWNGDCLVTPSSADMLKVHLVGLLKVLYSDILPFMHGLVLHASSLAMNDNAQVFTAPSGGGKSTISRLLPGKLIADDFTPILFDTKGPMAVACPFVSWEKVRYQQDKARLMAINRVIQGKDWQIKSLDKGPAITRILENTISFASMSQVKQVILDRAIDLAGMIPVRDLQFSLKTPSMEQISGFFN